MSRIGLVGENSVEYITTMINIWKNGDSVVIIDWRIPFKSIYKMLLEASVEKCYVDDSLVNKENDKCDIEFISYKINKSITEILSKNTYELFEKNYSHDEAVILYSSGTTGKSKGIILSHYAINTNADLIQNYMQLSTNDSIYIIKTLSHSSTIVGELLVALKNNIKLLISPTIISPRLILENIQKYKITTMCINPSLLHLLTMTPNAKKYLTGLRVIYTSGAILTKKILANALRAFPNTKILNVYGLTEAGPRVSAQRMDDMDNGVGSVGKVIDDVQVKIMLENGNEATNNELGIIHVKTPCQYSKYISEINSKISLYDNWLNTGDFGYFDEHNNLYIVGRHDNMIIIGSHNVYPEDIEKKLLEIEKLDNCIVIPEENQVYGFRIICFYVSQYDIEHELTNHCTEYLATYEKPYKFVKIDVLPTTSNGKNSRNINDYITLLEVLK